MRADIEPLFDLAGVFCRSCALSLPRLAHQHIRQSNAIDVRLLPGQSRREPLHHCLVHAHGIVLRPFGNVGYAVPWRSTLPLDIPSFGFAGQSITVACSVILAGLALNAFRIFHSSECDDGVNVPGGKGAVALDRSSAEAIDEIATRLVARYRRLLIITTSIVL